MEDNRGVFDDLIDIAEAFKILNVSRETLKAVNKYNRGCKVWAVNEYSITSNTVASLEIVGHMVFIYGDNKELIGTPNNVFTTREEAIEFYNKKHNLHIRN